MEMAFTLGIGLAFLIAVGLIEDEGFRKSKRFRKLVRRLSGRLESEP